MRRNAMTIAVVVKQSGKVEGIRGLYRDPRSGRFYVRWAYQGIDRQKTIEPKDETFTALSKAASKGMTALKREMMQAVSTLPERPRKQPVDAVQEGVDALPEVIERVWTARGIKAKGINYYKRCCEGLALCKRADAVSIHRVDAHNKATFGEALKSSELSECARWQLYKTVNLVFSRLIQTGEHKGGNPTISFAMPKYASQREDREISYEDMANIIHVVEKDDAISEIKRLELTLFFRLLCETGQRPVDIYYMNVRDIQNQHYRFKSQKTGRNQRVAHLLSPKTLAIIQELTIQRERAYYTWNLQGEAGERKQVECFWSQSWYTWQVILRTYAHKALGEGVKLYTCRHHFITEVFRITGSEFWASAFTHEGKGANQKFYLHADQDEADRICMTISNRLDVALNPNKAFDESAFVEYARSLLDKLP